MALIGFKENLTIEFKSDKNCLSDNDMYPPTNPPTPKNGAASFLTQLQITTNNSNQLQVQVTPNNSNS